MYILGEEPYPQTDKLQLIKLLRQGDRMPKPNHLDDTL